MMEVSQSAPLLAGAGLLQARTLFRTPSQSNWLHSLSPHGPHIPLITFVQFMLLVFLGHYNVIKLNIPSGQASTLQGVVASVVESPWISVGHAAPDDCGDGFVHVLVRTVSPVPQVTVQPASLHSLHWPGISVVVSSFLGSYFCAHGNRLPSHSKRHQYFSLTEGRVWGFCSSYTQIECWIQKTWFGIRLSGSFWEKSDFWPFLAKNWAFLANFCFFNLFREIFPQKYDRECNFLAILP